MHKPQNPLEPPPEKERHVGVVGLAGTPNVGKSTLVNRLIGQKISIVSDRPQTTRERICGIYTDDRMQLVLVDIPGILSPEDRFNECLMECAATSLKGCDLVLHMRDARRPLDPAEGPVIEMIRRGGRPVWLAWNKSDRAKRRPAAPMRMELPYEQTFAISAKTGLGVDSLLEAVAESLPVGPLLYSPDQVSDRDLRFLAAEMVREKLFRYLGDEIPYGTAAEVETWDETRGEKIYIRVLILTEREAHKPIIIGEKGAMLKKMGQKAREDIERLCDRPVYLELWVKVVPKWRKRDSELARMGLKLPLGG